MQLRTLCGTGSIPESTLVEAVDAGKENGKIRIRKWKDNGDGYDVFLTIETGSTEIRVRASIGFVEVLRDALNLIIPVNAEAKEVA
jgi:hypothetical protein